MKVLFYNHTAKVSGAERVLLLALRLMERSLIEPLVVCPNGKLSQKCNQLAIPVQDITELKARFTMRPDRIVFYVLSLMSVIRSLRKTILAARVDAVHANSIRAGSAALLATIGTGHIVFLHVHDELRPHLLSTAVRLMIRLSRRCRVIAVSEATAASLAGRGNAGSAVVIHNAVDLKSFDRLGREQDIRQEMGLEPDSFLFGIVGQITARKGQLELVKTFSKAIKQMPSAKLLVIGSPIFNDDNKYEAKVAEAVRESGLSKRVLFLGHRSDASQIIRNLDALVINSSSEGFVMVAIEAMAGGTPVIATDVGGTREMIQHLYNGLLVHHGCEDQLAAALVDLYTQKEARQIFATRSRKIVEERLDAPRFISEFQSALLSAQKQEAHGRGHAAFDSRVCENQ